MSVLLATEEASILAAYRLYLPERWANDKERRKEGGVPKEISFQTTPGIALAQVRSLVNEDVRRGVVLADAAYGDDSGFREGLVSLQLCYAVGIKSSTTLWPPGIMPTPPRPKGKMGRPPSLLRRDEQHQPLTARQLALCLSSTDLHKVSWRGLDAANYRVEQAIRPMIVTRKVWGGNLTAQSAHTQSVIVSICRLAVNNSDQQLRS